MTPALAQKEKVCTFNEAWRGECGDAVVTDDPPRCSDHRDKTCRVCGEPATRECPQTFGLVCGTPLCDDCECPSSHELYPDD